MPVRDGEDPFRALPGQCLEVLLQMLAGGSGVALQHDRMAWDLAMHTLGAVGVCGDAARRALLDAGAVAALVEVRLSLRKI